MKKKFAAVLLCLWAAPATAFHMGLGSAVAGEGAKLADRAAIPSCGGRFTLFTRSPVDTAMLTSIEPLGHTYSTGHIFPSDHMYFNFLNAQATASAGLYAPSDGWIVAMERVTYQSGGPALDYMVTFSPCSEVRLTFMHVSSLSPALAAKFGGCDYSSSGAAGNEVFSNCRAYALLPVRAGDLLGSGVIGDFGPLEDSRLALSGFASPGRHDLHRGFCSLNYFTPDAAAALTAKLGLFTGGALIPRTIAPVCGTIMQDVLGTAQGDWYLPGAPDRPEDPHLALIHDDVFASTAVFSVGTSAPGLTGINYLFPKTSPDATLINYDFNLVDDNQIHCYEDFHALPRSVGGNTLAGKIVLLQLPDAAKQSLKIELQGSGASTCAGTIPWAFTGAAVTYQR